MEKASSQASPLLIDPPGYFQPREQWSEFRAHLRTLPQSDPGVKAAIRQANKRLMDTMVDQTISSRK